jgi:hypothetical protein
MPDQIMDISGRLTESATFFYNKKDSKTINLSIFRLRLSLKKFLSPQKISA